MKRNYLILCLLPALLLLQSCQEKQNKTMVMPLKTAPDNAYGTYLTQDHQGNAVVCWAEKSAADSLYRLKYAVFDAVADSFSMPVFIPGSVGMTAVAESMGKVAFKADGTVMAIFGKRFEKEKNPYAGAIYYTYSKDGGKNWTKNQFLHSDTAHQYGRSFFDIRTLKDGELAAVWLDGRFGKALKGSALYFARTEKGQGFTNETLLDKGTCECCRTSILQGENGNIHIAYRSIMFPLQLEGKQVRDMAYIFSNDNGRSFSKPETLSEDHWQVEGCPHSGPSLAVLGQSVNAVWFTAGGVPGVCYTHKVEGAPFKKRNLLSSTARHPQMLALPGGKLAVVFEENDVSDGQEPGKMNHAHGGMNGHYEPAAPSKIVLTVLKEGKTVNKMNITEGNYADHHAVLTLVPGGMLVAWTREAQGQARLYYSRVSLQ